MHRKGAEAVLALSVLVGSGLFAIWYFEWWPTPEVVPTGVGPRLYGPDEESLDGKPINILLFHR